MAEPSEKSTFDDTPATAVINEVRPQSTKATAANPPSPCNAASPRVVEPASSMSHRPASSSPRRSRELVNRPQIAPTIMSVIDTLSTVNPPTVCRSGAGPKSAMVDLFAPYVAARLLRWAWVL